jgi:hypothetical protein
MTEKTYAVQRKDRMAKVPDLIPAYFARIAKGKLLTH